MSGSVSMVDGHIDPSKGSTAYKSWINSDFFNCPVCGKRFYIPPYVTEWTYKTKIKGYPVPVCSYSCFNKVTPNRKLKGEHYLKNINKWQKKRSNTE